MPHPLVLQLRFARSEWWRGLHGLTEADAQQHFGPMNCISWNVGHLAWQEQRYWLWRGQDIILLQEINQRFAYGAPACTPTLSEATAAWQTIVAAADPWLDTLTAAQLQERHDYVVDDQPDFFTLGSLMQRTIYHYWYHNGENMAMRQMLGHPNLAEFVGDIDTEAPYLPH